MTIRRLKRIVRIKIATNPELTMYYYKAYEHTISSGHFFPELPLLKNKVEGDKFEIATDFNDNMLCRKDPELVVENNGNSIQYNGSWGNMKAIEGKRLEVSSSRNNPYVRMMILKWGIGMLLHQKGYLILHGCSVALEEGTAILFSGENGAGKSTTTLAFLKAGCKYTSDDILVLDFNGDELKVIPSFPQLKLWEQSIKGLAFKARESSLKPFTKENDFIKYQLNSDQHFLYRQLPVKAIYYLIRPADTEPPARPISGLDAYFTILEQFYLDSKALSGEFMTTNFLQMTRLLSQIPVFQLNRPKDFVRLEQFVDDMMSSIPV